MKQIKHGQPTGRTVGGLHESLCAMDTTNAGVRSISVGRVLTPKVNYTLEHNHHSTCLSGTDQSARITAGCPMGGGELGCAG
jgi:hypothetical protein